MGCGSGRRPGFRSRERTGRASFSSEARQDFSWSWYLLAWRTCVRRGGVRDCPAGRRGKSSGHRLRASGVRRDSAVAVGQPARVGEVAPPFFRGTDRFFHHFGLWNHSPPAPLFGLSLLVKGGIILFLGMVLMVLGVLAGVFSLFFLPIALAGYLARRRLEAAFHPATLLGGINRILTEYVATYVLSVGLFSGGHGRCDSLRWPAGLAVSMVLFAPGASQSFWGNLR